jgi:hypothetical protein
LSYSGFVQAGAQLGLESILMRPKRGIYSPALADGSYLEDIIAQAVVEERHIDQLEITNHPVQYGAAIIDHAFKHPSEVVLTLGWSNSPSNNGKLNNPGNLVNVGLGTAAAINPLAREAANAALIAAAAASLLFGDEIGQIRDVYNSLIALQETRAIFTLYTAKKIYQNMLCKMLVTETDYKTENALIVTMTCQQVLFATTQTVQTSKLSTKKSVNASVANKGPQNAYKVQ